MALISNIRKAIRIYNEDGFGALAAKFAWRLEERRNARLYDKWVERNAITPAKREAIRREIADFQHNPLISVVVPVYNIDEKWLRLCLESVLDQIYENWELCIADDKSTKARVREVIEEVAKEDLRIKVVFREENGHISAASNSALDLASGEFTVLLDHDDELSEDALFQVVKTINEHPETAFIYSDEDLLDENGKRIEPKFKPDFSRDLLYSLNLITHLSAYRTEILRSIGGFRLGTEGSQDYDLALRVIETIDESQIHHIPRILYHWRAIRGSVAFAPGEKPYAYERAREAIREHLARCGKTAKVSETTWNMNRVSYVLPERNPKIQVVVFGGAEFDLAAEYSRFAATAIDSSTAADFNRAALDGDAELVCFVNSRLKPMDPDWLGELAGFAMQDGIGAAGARIVDPDGMVAGGGLVFGGREIVRAAHGMMPWRASGNMCRNQLISNFSAISIDCLMIRRDLFAELKGFDSERFPSALFDADLCLRLGEKGLRIVLTPYAELRGRVFDRSLNDDETREFRGRWQKVIDRDPFYNPNLSLTGRTFSLPVE